MSRHCTFRFCLDPTVAQRDVLARHAGASRFAFNQSLRIVKTSLEQRKAAPDTKVPSSGFDLINTFNTWKKTEAAGRIIVVDSHQQVFEEAAVDLGRALASWSESRSGKRNGKRVGFPRFKEKTGAGAVVSAAQQTPQGRHVGDPGR